MTSKWMNVVFVIFFLLAVILLVWLYRDLYQPPEYIKNAVYTNPEVPKTRLVNSIVTDYNEELKYKLQNLTQRKAGARDPEVIALVRELMDPPSEHILKKSRSVLQTPQSKAIMQILKRKKDGFFIECGALDGERSSNTLHLEQSLGWTGVLIEMDPYFYTQLLGKSRRSHSINACLSPHSYVVMAGFKEHSCGAGRLVKPDSQDDIADRMVPCFPLESILLALNRTHVDYFSLDVEGLELEVLQTIPFDRVDISTLSVEYAHGPPKTRYTEFMESKGFVAERTIEETDRGIHLFVKDFIFVKDNLLI